ncbi:tRNA dimethylallyltransferase 9 isoform X1, partial [Sesbania bispinosa]
ETILNFIHDAYHDRNGSFLVPEHLKMSKDISNHREATKLKAYRTKNRHFVSGEDCSCVLDWIRKTQKLPDGDVPSVHSLEVDANFKL